MSTLPLYTDLQVALQTPGFITKGGVLGFACNHIYAHNRSDEAVYLSSKLKGVDMVIYATYKTLGLQVSVRPVFDESRAMDHLDSWEGDNNG